MSLETANVRVCAHSPIESLLGKERNATTSHFVSDYSEFVSEVLDNFNEGYLSWKSEFLGVVTIPIRLSLWLLTNQNLWGLITILKVFTGNVMANTFSMRAVMQLLFMLIMKMACIHVVMF